jgi:deoxyhypusine monooxygenase
VDTTQPLAKRFRAVFLLKNIGTEEAVLALSNAFWKDESALLRHEVAYCIGQMGKPVAIPILEKVLENDTDEMVRHEAGEALGAIGKEECLPILQRFVKDPCQEVAETCEIAIDTVKWKLEHPEEVEANFPSSEAYLSVDPAPPLTAKDVPTLRATLMDKNLPLFVRYQAMFSLRNLSTKEAVLALCDGFNDEKSALFRHEIAYVLGQVSHPASADALKEIVGKNFENKMVRHEAAEALGAIANMECVEFLRQYVDDKERVVRESCDIALDMADYLNSDQFQYADAVMLSN